jgi:hypothetical protein
MDFVFASTIGQLGVNRLMRRSTAMWPTTSAVDFAPLSQGPRSRSPRSRGRPPASCGTARPPGHDRPRRARSDQQASNLRKQGNLQLLDVTVRQGDTVTLAVNATSNLPAWVSYVGPNANLGDVTYRTALRRLRTGKGHSTADRLCHHHRLSQCRAEQTLRRSQHRRCAD